MTIRNALLGASLLLLAAPALAQEEQAGPPDDSNSLTIGIGGAIAPTYEGSDDYVLTPAAIAFGKVAGFSYYTRGTSLFFDLIQEPVGAPIDIAVGPAANIRFDRSTRIKDDRVEALGELDTAIELGGFVGIGKTGILHAYDSLSARVQYVQDVTDTHDSYVITPAVEYGTPLSRKLYVGANLSADYTGDRFARTYYGVDDAGSARSGLRAFDPDGGWKNMRIALLGTHTLTGDLTRPGLAVWGVASYSSIFGDFKRSPLVRDVGDNNQYFAALGLSYSF